MGYLLDPKMDFIFKLLFGNEKHPEILVSFLNAVIKPQKKIVSVEFENVELNKELIQNKYSRLDVLAKTSNDELVNVEIQLNDEKNMIKRSLFYLSKAYIKKLKSGQDYDLLPRTVTINILRFEYLDEENFHNAYRFKNTENNNELTDVFELHFIELPKFDEKKEGKLLVKNLKKLDMLKAWTLFLKEPESEEVSKIEDEVTEIKKAKSELTFISSDEKNRRLYEAREDALHEEASALGGARRKGLEEGIKKGRKEGIKKAKRELTINMLKDMELISKIIKYTGLTKEEILKIAKEENLTKYLSK